MNQRHDGIPVIPPNNLVQWCGLLLQKDAQSDMLKANDGDWSWEVDVTMNEDDLYEARVYHKGVKLAGGIGKTRPKALTVALQALAILENKISNQAFSRREGGRVHTNRKA